MEFDQNEEQFTHDRRFEVEEAITRIIEENGYNENNASARFPQTEADRIPLIFSYVGDCSAPAINEVVKSSGLPIRLVFYPSPTLKHDLYPRLRK